MMIGNMINFMLLLIWCFIFIKPISSQICNSNDPGGKGVFLPALSNGDHRPTKQDGSPYLDSKNNTPLYCSDVAKANGCKFVTDPQPMAVLYIVLLLWCFLGVGLFADVFMGAIEIITSKKKYIEIPTANNEVKQIEVYIWNDTVANLTLMALGSSAPEILLSVIEILGNEFKSGELGPSTIVGSAAFNLMVIIAVCISAIPKPNPNVGESGFRRIKNLGVFNVTAFFSVFAYIWILIIVQGFSPNVVSLPEALVTLFFFPSLVVLAYLIDSGKLDRLLKRNKEQEEYLTGINQGPEMIRFPSVYEINDLLKEEKKKGNVYFGKDPVKLAEMATYKSFQEKKVSRALYRVNANRMLTGGKSVIPEKPVFKEEKKEEMKQGKAMFCFGASRYTVLESSKEVKLTVQCRRKQENDEGTYSIRYKSGDVKDTAKAGEDYVAVDGRLEFSGSQTSQTIKIEIVDDDLKESDEIFTVRLLEPKGPPDCDQEDVKILQNLGEAKITIIDDDSPGKISFAEHKEEAEKKMSVCYEVKESAGEVSIKVVRVGGSSGTVSVHYKTEDGQRSNKAIAGYDYVKKEGELVFNTGEVEKYIHVEIIDDEEFEKDEVFYVKISEPQHCEIGHLICCKVIIKNDDEMSGVGKQVMQLMKMNLDKYKLGSENYKGQFAEAIEYPSEESSWRGKIMFWLLVPFKLICALIPPTTFMGGWLCFIVSLIFIGIITAIIGDLASLFGCSVGLENSITAITIVALGTSLPDTFASMAAATNDKCADNSIGNVTGSNSVNVFLGLGLPWSLAAIKWTIDGKDFIVPAGDLGFSVTVFTICAVVSLTVLYLRRWKLVGELGGSHQRESSILLVTLWFLYIILSILKIKRQI